MQWARAAAAHGTAGRHLAAAPKSGSGGGLSSTIDAEATELELSARWVLEPPERWVVHGQTRVAGPLTTAE